MTKKPLSLIIACGGTGGHLFPGIAVAQNLKQRGHRVTLLISEKQVDSLASSKYGDLDFRKIPAIAPPKPYSPAIFPFLKRFWNTIRECKNIIDAVEADAVLGMGGFTSFPPVFAASRKKIPAFIHESNAMPGKSNRLTARWCQKVLLGVHEAAPYFPHNETIVTGTPIRLELATRTPREEAARNMGLNPAQKTVLVMGGSQGARNLNTLVVEAAKLCEGLCQFLIIAGQSDHERVSGLAKELKHVKVLPFCSDMGSAYGCADLAISRSGASSLTELAYLGIPALLVPFPFAADDHQAHNARVFSINGAAVVIRQNVLDAERISAFLHKTLTSPETLAAMKRACRENAVQNSDALIAKAIETFVSQAEQKDRPTEPPAEEEK